MGGGKFPATIEVKCRNCPRIFLLHKKRGKNKHFCSYSCNRKFYYRKRAIKAILIRHKKLWNSVFEAVKYEKTLKLFMERNIKDTIFRNIVDLDELNTSREVYPRTC